MKAKIHYYMKASYDSTVDAQIYYTGCVVLKDF